MFLLLLLLLCMHAVGLYTTTPSMCVTGICPASWYWELAGVLAVNVCCWLRQHWVWASAAAPAPAGDSENPINAINHCFKSTMHHWHAASRPNATSKVIWFACLALDAPCMQDTSKRACYC